ncbi:MAG: aminotransferase class V-fold PLP-dependent enzyme [Actinomycetota bacterium]
MVSARATLAYFDHAATAPMRREAIEAMRPYLDEQFANPSGSHRFSRAARQVVDEARDDVADVLGCTPGEVVFTSGGTEADNAAVFGAVRRHGGVACAVPPNTMRCCTAWSTWVAKSSTLIVAA